MIANVDEHRIVREAMGRHDADSLMEAMKEEMVALKKNVTWDLVPFLEVHKPIGRKWVFNKKLGPNGSVEKYKACLVVKGNSKVEGIDYGEIFSPIAKLTPIRLLLSLAEGRDLEAEHMDVKTTFLHGDLE